MARRWDSGLKKPINPSVVPQQYGVTDEEKAKWNGKQDALKYDEQPIEGSSNIVNSGSMHRTLEKFREDTEKAYKDYFNGAVDGLGTATNLLNQTSTLLEAVQHEVEIDRQEVSFNKELVEQYTEAALSYQNSAAHCAQIAQELVGAVAITPEEIDALIAVESAAIKEALPYGAIQIVAADTDPNTLTTPGLYRFITTTEGTYGTRTIIKVWQMDDRYIVQERIKMTAGYMLLDSTQIPYASRRTYDTTTRTWTPWNNSITQADVIDELTSTYTKTPLSANQGRVLKELIDALSADNTAIQDVLTNSGLNSHLVGDNLIPTNLTFADLIAKTTVTFFANTTDETNFPRSYGSGVMIPDADVRYRQIYYQSGYNTYFGRITVSSGTVEWKTCLNDTNGIFRLSNPTFNSLKAFVEGTANNIGLAYGFQFKDNAGWTPRVGSWWQCWVQYQNQYTSSYSVSGNIILMNSIINSEIFHGFISGNNGSYTVKWSRISREGITVWTNASISSSFTASTINITPPDVRTGYEILFFDKYASSASGSIQRTTGKLPFGTTTSLVGAQGNTRMVWVSSNATQITFQNAVNPNDTSNANLYCVPYKIIYHS